MAKTSATELTLSVRLIWPVARALEGNPIGDELLARMGLTVPEFVDPETRVPVQLAIDLLEELAQRLGDPLIGVRAGERVEFADFDILEHAARSAPNLGEGQAVMWRYMGLMHDAMEFHVEHEGELVCSHYRFVDGLEMHPTTNDFTIACALGFSKRNMREYMPPIEVRLAHERPSYADRYHAFFKCPVKFGGRDNVIVTTKERMATPMLAASPSLAEAFAAQAERLLAKVKDQQGYTGRVHADIASHLGAETVSMEITAKRLAIGVATLRRKLQEEGTTFSEIVDELRRDLAQRYLKDGRNAISEIAFLLGFSDVRAFGRAFKRWTNLSPTEYRAGKR